jgi:hypothetical protein
VIGRKDAVIPMPMLPRRRDEIGEPQKVPATKSG